MITFQLARLEEASIITKLRYTIWQTTYRGIYPDDVIDDYDWDGRFDKDRQKIGDIRYQVFLIKDQVTPIGYFILENQGEILFIQSLYLLKDYQKRGIGAQAFALAREYGVKHGFKHLRCNCNVHNHEAQVFYEKMGGKVIQIDDGHENKQEDQLTFDFEMETESE